MYCAVVTYDGTCYLGWQKTRFGPSIQEELEKAIYRITQENQSVEAASRTDRGVHAKGQVVQFQLNTPWDPPKLLRALNALLPHDIRILSLKRQSFHPTLDAIGKEYHYHLHLAEVQNPTQRLYSWHIHQPLDIPKMQQEIQPLLGTHDFSAFANEKEKNPICTVHCLELVTLPQTLCSLEAHRLYFRIQGDRFLYKMVRNIIGSLVYVGRGKLTSLTTVLQSKDRKKAGITAPAHGLYLHQAFYPVT